MDYLYSSGVLLTGQLLLMYHVVMQHMENVPTESLTIQTPDGVNLAATFVPATQVRAPAILLLHMLGRERSTYQPLFPALHKAGFGLLAIDFRGHGESTSAAEKKINWEDFNEEAWQNILIDAEVALQTLKKQRGVDPDHLGIIGASIGANAALLTAAKSEAVKSIALLSPGLDYRGLAVEPALAQIEDRSTLIVASQTDNYAFESSKTLAQKLSNATLVELEGETHGTNMFLEDPRIVDSIVNFFKSTLSAEETNHDSQSK